MSSTLHIRFNIDAVGGGAYGLACYKMVFAHAPAGALRGCAVSMGDSNATLNGQENVCVIGLAGSVEQLRTIMSALKSAPAFKSACASNPLVLDGPREPLVSDGVYTDDGGNLDSWAKAAFDDVQKGKSNEKKSEAPAVNESGALEKPASHLFLAWFSILFAWIIAIFAIKNANQVNVKWDQGDYEGARKASKRALTLSIISIIVGILGIIAITMADN